MGGHENSDPNEVQEIGSESMTEKKQKREGDRGVAEEEQWPWKRGFKGM